MLKNLFTKSCMFQMNCPEFLGVIVLQFLKSESLNIFCGKVINVGWVI